MQIVWMVKNVLVVIVILLHNQALLFVLDLVQVMLTASIIRNVSKDIVIYWQHNSQCNIFIVYLMPTVELDKNVLVDIVTH